MLTILGSKVHKSDASLLAGVYLNLGPAKNMSKKPFFEKNERITNVFRIAGVQSTQQFGIRGVKVIERLRENVECEGRFHISWNTRILS